MSTDRPVGVLFLDPTLVLGLTDSLVDGLGRRPTGRSVDLFPLFFPHKEAASRKKRVFKKVPIRRLLGRPADFGLPSVRCNYFGGPQKDLQENAKARNQPQRHAAFCHFDRSHLVFLQMAAAAADVPVPNDEVDDGNDSDDQKEDPMEEDDEFEGLPLSAAVREAAAVLATRKGESIGFRDTETAVSMWFRAVESHIYDDDPYMHSTPPPRLKQEAFDGLLRLLLPHGLADYMVARPRAFVTRMFDVHDGGRAVCALLDAHANDPKACPIDLNAIPDIVSRLMQHEDDRVLERALALCSDARLNQRYPSGFTVLTNVLLNLSSGDFYGDITLDWDRSFRRTEVLLSKVEQDGTGLVVTGSETRRDGMIFVSTLGTAIRQPGQDGKWCTASAFLSARLSRIVSPFDDARRPHLEQLLSKFQAAEARVLAYRAQFLPTLDAALSESLPVFALRHLVIASYALAPS
jgi:hypothetical protein